MGLKMHFKEAFTYISNNYESLKGSCVLGLAYTPDDEVDFQLVELSLDDEAKTEEGTDYYSVSVEGGNIPSGHEGIEDFYSGGDLDVLCEDLPDFVTEIKYRIYNLNEAPNGLTVEYALKAIFPSLPNPDDLWGDEILDFKNKAIHLIQERAWDMGQAKNRGSLEDRIKQAQEQKANAESITVRWFFEDDTQI